MLFFTTKAAESAVKLFKDWKKDIKVERLNNKLEIGKINK